MRLILRPLSLDLRGLAALRLFLGILVMLDALIRSSDLIAHYADSGVLPRSVLLTEFSNPYHFSLLFLSGQPLWVCLCLLVYGLTGLALAFGWRTWLSTLLAWVLMLSLHNRNPVVLNGGDVYFRVLLCWSLFLPLAARCSLDRARSLTGIKPSANLSKQEVLTGGSVGLVLQVMLMYVCTAALKTSAEWLPEGTALWYANTREQFTTPIGDGLQSFPELLKWLTWGVYGIGWVGPLLLLCPFWHVWMRTIGVLLLISLHLGLILTMELGFFPWICLAVLISLFPKEIWDWLASRNWLRSVPTEHLILYYDQDCGFCRRMVGVLREFFLFGRAEIRPIQVDPVVYALFDNEAPNSWVVQQREHYAFAGEGLWLVLQQSPWSAWLTRFLSEAKTLLFLEGLYAWVVRHRSQLGRSTAWIGSRRSPPKAVPNRYLSAVALVLVVLVVGYNLRYSFFKEVPLPTSIKTLFTILRLDQYWNIFYSQPGKDDGWFMMEGELRDGTPIDVYRLQLGEVSLEKPVDLSVYYSNQRWRKYLTNLWLKKYKDYRLHYGRYLCRHLNSRERDRERKLTSFQIYFIMERTGFSVQSSKPTEKRTIWRHECFKKKD
jgi:predicted DCC family thiol-disulfide oxidoreductase YuxK